MSPLRFPHLPTEVFKGLQTAFLVLVAVTSPVWASGEPGEVIPNAAYTPITDTPGLPRVLLIGDSISVGYTLPARKNLEGKANVHRIPENGGNSRNGLEKLDAWLGTGKWDLIHFNFGLHDIRYRGGKPAISPTEYEENLRKIVQRLKQTGATVVWCSTTPVPDAKLKRERHDKDAREYNQIALKIMQENNIPVDDLYAFALPQLEKIQNRNDVHFSEEGYAALAGHVSDEILGALKK